MRLKRDAAADAAQAAEVEYRNILLAGDAALDAARKAFEAEQAWMAEQRSKLPTEDPARMQELRRIADHARATYEQIQRDLERFACLGLARPFLADIEARLQRAQLLMDRIDAKLGRPAGGEDNSGDSATAGGDGAMAGDGAAKGDPAQPLGDEYVLIGGKPEIRHGEKCSATGTTITFTLEVDGNQESGSITVEGIPTSIRVGQRVELKITAQGTPKAYAAATIYGENVFASQPQGEGSVGSWPGYRAGDHAHGSVSFIFGANQYEPKIIFYGGKYNDDPRNAIVVYRYKKAGT